MNAEQLLRNLGVTGTLKGFRFAAYMIEMVKQDPTSATQITKYIYPESAQHFNVSPSTVERNLRTIVQICWSRGDRNFLEKVAGTHLTFQPTNGMFLDMTAAFLREQAET